MSTRIQITPCWLLAGCILLATGTSIAASEPSATWDFDVLLNGKQIGSHRFQVLREGEQTSLLSEASFKVTLLSVPVYHYRHTSRETFRNDCLQQMEANTDENGSHEQVHGAVGDSAFVVTAQAGDVRLPACVMTFDYWNPRILQQSHLLNPQTGMYTPVVIAHLGSENLMVEGKSEQADTYLLTAETLKIKLWYSPERRWLALESTTPDGKLMRYQLR
jgi:hypothetical protein